MQIIENSLSEACCTCLKSGVCLVNTSEKDSNNIDCITKLKFCVPELEWTKGYICTSCLEIVNQTYIFKELCFKTSEILKKRNADLNVKAEEEGPIDHVDTIFSDSDSFLAASPLNDQNEDYKEQVDNENKPLSAPKRTVKKLSSVPVFKHYNCKLCKRRFTDRNLLFSHRRNRHKLEKSFNCVYCDKEFKLAKQLKRHEVLHLNQRLFTCKICFKSFNESSTLCKHNLIKHGDPEKWKYVCPHCGNKYPFRSNLVQHVTRNHTNVGDVYICYHCNESYESKVSLIAHIRSKHNPNIGNFSNPMKECQICKKVYINKTVLENHLRKEHNIGNTTLTRRVKQYPCEKCGKQYTTTETLNKHVKVCDGIKRHVLRKPVRRKERNEIKQEKNSSVDSNQEDSLFDVKELDSDRDFSDEENIKQKKKKRKDTEEPKPNRRSNLSCEFCEESIGPYKKLVAHAVEKHGADPETLRPYRCQQCEERFTSIKLRDKHAMTSHERPRSHICAICGKGFMLRKQMLNHEKLHSNIRDVQCEICSKRYQTKSHLMTHKKVVHTDPMKWKYECPYCSKRFPMKSNFEHHIRRHTGEKPFACHLCEKRFTDKFTLQQHFGTHSNIRQFKCDHCEMEYKSNKALRIHLKKVHDIGNAKIPDRPKKFICDYCSKPFAEKDKLKRHMYSHTGERPFGCQICEKRFTDKSYVKQHMKSVHNIHEERQD